jgi:ketosteroid isomerase-like protein
VLETGVSFRAQRVALVERILQARVNGDFNCLEALSAPDIVVKLIGDAVLFSYCGEYHGRADARHALERVHVEFSFHDMMIDHLMVDGEQAAMRWNGILRNRGTGASAHFEGFTHLIFENGLIKEYYSLVDTATMGTLK